MIFIPEHPEGWDNKPSPKHWIACCLNVIFLVLPPITFYFFLYLIWGAYCHSLGKIFIVFSRPTQVLAIVLLVVKIFN